MDQDAKTEDRDREKRDRKPGDDESQGFSKAYEEFRRRVDLFELNIDPDEIWGDVRDQSPGRDFEW